MKEWQKNPNEITTDKVQFWANGIMLTAQMTKKEAREKIKNGSAFVISEQAIGAIINGKIAS